MQLNAITRKSALPAILLLITVLVASAFRYGFNPYDVELAHSEFRERFVSILVAMLLFLAGGMIEGKMLTRSGLTKALYPFLYSEFWLVVFLLLPICSQPRWPLSAWH